MQGTNSYPRETVEFAAVDISVVIAGTTTPVQDAIQFCITQDSDRPEAWIDAVTLGDDIGVMIQGYDNLESYPAKFTIWAQVTDSPEIPVINCGSFKIT